jgi:alpha-L-glutamate ligase-like protein
VNPIAALRRAGVLGINRRNVGYTLLWNDRRFYPRVDDKLATKALCQKARIPTPKLLAVARHHFELSHLRERLADLSSFVLKPARGTMGNGVLVVLGRDGEQLLRPEGRTISVDDLIYHAASIISGLYALGGQADAAVVEERLEVHADFREITRGGVPDIRVIVFRGVPVMAMTRLPTRRSGGRANLHQGAVGAGIDLVSGETLHAVLQDRYISVHPDTEKVLIDRPIPHFERVLEIAVRATDETELGYVGADIVVDAHRGPMILELNARPGLAVQIANRAGLLPRLNEVEEKWQPGLPVSERIALGRSLASL